METNTTSIIEDQPIQLPKFVLNGKEYVILSKEKLDALLEELEDLRDSLAIADAERRNEPSMTIQELAEKLDIAL